MAEKPSVVEVVSFTASPDRLRTPMTMYVLDLSTHLRLTQLSGTFSLRSRWDFILGSFFNANYLLSH